MKHRITYLPVDDTTSKSAELVVDDDGIRVPPIPAAKEWFITGEIEELADKVDTVLSGYIRCSIHVLSPVQSVDLLHKLSRFHVHWASAANYAVAKPLVARPAPGLHLSLSGRSMDEMSVQSSRTACLCHTNRVTDDFLDAKSHASWLPYCRLSPQRVCL